MRFHRQLAWWGLLAICASATAERLPGLPNMTPEMSLVSTTTLRPLNYEPVMIKPVTPPCTKFVEPFDVDDYRGPLSNLVTRFSQGIDNKTPHVRGNSAVHPCQLNAGDKFRLFVNDNIDPLAYVGAAWDAGWAQYDYDDRSFGQGAEGYSKRYAAEVVDNVQSDFFGMFLYPSLFHQDPRYYRMGEGPFRARLGHALAHRFVTRSDAGSSMPNYSEWFGTVSSKALSNMYHPGNPRGFGPTASRVGFSVGNGMAWDVLREFWPEMSRKFRLPFRTNQEPK